MLSRQVDGGAHAPGDGLAVQKADVAGLGLERVAEGVTEIQDAAQIAFALVAGDHFGFHADGIADDAVDGVRSARARRGLGGQKVEEPGFADDAGFDDLPEAGAVFALGQGVEHGGIDQYGDRLVEAADEILAAHQVDAGLAADGRVHLRQQGGGDLEERECRA